jgi:hypothetical protein
MNTIQAHVWRAIADKQEEMFADALAGEKDVLAEQPEEGGRLGPLLRHYSKFYEDLADLYVEQFRWANEHSDSKELRSREFWYAGMIERLGAAHAFAKQRIDTMPAPLGVRDGFYKQASLLLLTDLFARVCERLDVNLERAEAEFRARDKRKNQDRFEKFYWLAGGGIGGAAITLVTQWLGAVLKIGSHG